MDAAPYHEWDIEEKMVDQWARCSCGASWWSEDFGDCWTLQIFPNGMLQQDVGRVVLQLTMIRMPPKVQSIRAHVVLSSNYMRIRTEGVMVFSYDNHAVCVWRDGSFPTKWIRHRLEEWLSFKAEIFVTEVVDRHGVAVHERSWNKVGILSTASLSMRCLQISNQRSSSVSPNRSPNQSLNRLGSVNRPSYQYGANNNRMSGIASNNRLSSALVAAANSNRLSSAYADKRRGIVT